jgi:hypothetical protein
MKRAILWLAPSENQLRFPGKLGRIIDGHPPTSGKIGWDQDAPEHRHHIGRRTH